MANDDTLFDYIYKKKLDEDFIPVLDTFGEEHSKSQERIRSQDHPNFVSYKHYFTVHKMLYTKSNRLSCGLIKSNKGLTCNLSQKQRLWKDNTFKTNLKFSSDSVAFKNKIKHKIGDSFFCEVIITKYLFGITLYFLSNKIFLLI